MTPLACKMAYAEPKMPTGLVVSCFEAASYIIPCWAAIYVLRTCQDLRRLPRKARITIRLLLRGEILAGTWKLGPGCINKFCDAGPCEAHRASPCAPPTIIFRPGIAALKLIMFGRRGCFTPADCTTALLSRTQDRGRRSDSVN